MNVSLESAKFNLMVKELQRMPGSAHKKVLKAQAKTLLERCVQYTPAASAKKIRQSVKYRNSRSRRDQSGGEIVTLNIRQGAPKNHWMLSKSAFGGRKGAKPKGKGSGRVALLMKGPGADRRWSNKRWQAYKRMVGAIKANKEDPKKALEARGLAKQSWTQGGKAIGVTVAAPSFVKSAKPTSGNASRMATGKEISEGGNYTIEIRNYNRILNGKGFQKMKQGRAAMKVKFNGHRIMSRAMKARYSAFMMDMKKGVFKNIALRAQRYPGIFTK